MLFVCFDFVNGVTRRIVTGCDCERRLESGIHQFFDKHESHDLLFVNVCNTVACLEHNERRTLGNCRIIYGAVCLNASGDGCDAPFECATRILVRCAAG